MKAEPRKQLKKQRRRSSAAASPGGALVPRVAGSIKQRPGSGKAKKSAHAWRRHKRYKFGLKLKVASAC